jgi:hypothetical protein
MKRPQPSPWWVPILLAFLGLTACLLTVAYLSWIQVAGKLYVFGLVMVLANLSATIAAIVATGMDARSGRVNWSWWAVLFTFVAASMVLFPMMATWAPR